MLFAWLGEFSAHIKPLARKLQTVEVNMLFYVKGERLWCYAYSCWKLFCVKDSYEREIMMLCSTCSDMTKINVVTVFTEILIVYWFVNYQALLLPCF